MIITDSLIALFVISINILMMLLVWRSSAQALVKRSFALVCLSIVLWTVANFGTDYSGDLLLIQIFAHLTMFFASCVILSLLFFSIAFCRPSLYKTRKIRGALLIGCAGFLLFSLSDLVVSGVALRDDGADILVGPLYVHYMSAIAALVLGVVYIFAQSLKSSSNREKSQIRLILLGAVLSVLSGALTNAVLPVLTDNWHVAKYGPFFTIFFVASISYAIIRHRLFDVRFIVARSVAYLMVLFVMGGIYALVVFSIVNKIYASTTVSLAQQLTYMAMAMLLAFTFQPLKEFFDRVTDRIFFRDRYSIEDIVKDITIIAAGTLNLEELSGKTLERLSEGMKISRSSLWIVEDEDFYCAAEHNLSVSELSKYEPDVLLELAATSQGSVLFIDELKRSSERVAMRRAGMAVAIPLYVGDELQGILLLGEKRSGEIYTEQDLNALRILGPSLAISLENARSYKQISEFNQTLADEVDKATRKLTVANDKLQRSNVKLRQLDSLKDEFISITSHELRTPLTAIRGYLWMAMHGKAGNAKTEAEYMERAYTSTERLIALVNDSLDISRIDSGRVQLNPLPTDIYGLAQEVVADLLPRAQQQEQLLKVKRPHKTLPAVVVDPEKLYQVLTNLVGNALKFTPSKGQIVVSFAIDGDKVVTTVSDTGPGISDEDKKRLFQKFSRLDASATIPGTGLGLFLCREIIHLSKGRIWVESKLGHGSSFKFALPTTTTKAVKAEGRGQHPQRIVVA